MSWRVEVATRIGALDLDVVLDGDGAPAVLIGPNGSGKTTLLRLIAGARSPRSGLVRVGSRTLFDARTDIDLPPEARRVGYVPQGFGLFPHLRVIDNVAFGLTWRTPRRSLAERRDAARKLLEKLGCVHLVDRWPGQLSGGEQQRVALARALLVEPELLLLDEPLSALDAASRRAMRGFLSEYLAASGCPSIVVTHDLRDVLALGGEVFVLERGRLVQRGSAAELRAAPASDFVAEFFDLPGATDLGQVSAIMAG